MTTSAIKTPTKKLTKKTKTSPTKNGTLYAILDVECGIYTEKMFKRDVKCLTDVQV
jgi:hypothetical protein